MMVVYYNIKVLTTRLSVKIKDKVEWKRKRLMPASSPGECLRV